MQQVIQPAAQINENDVVTCIIFEVDCAQKSKRNDPRRWKRRGSLSDRVGGPALTCLIVTKQSLNCATINLRTIEINAETVLFYASAEVSGAASPPSSTSASSAV
ncbi:hypothetical protein NeNHUV3_03790 [Nereida sp. NH-UV-3]